MDPIVVVQAERSVRPSGYTEWLFRFSDGSEKQILGPGEKLDPVFGESPARWAGYPKERVDALYATVK